MQIHYEEDVVESAVAQCAAGRIPGGQPLQVRRFHREREKLYSILDPDDRNAAFFKLHLDWFREWGLERALVDILKEYPLLSTTLARLVIRQARGNKDEGSELYVNDASEKSAVLAFRVQRFAAPALMTAWVRHELMHLHDMVAPEFGYSPELGNLGWMPHQQRLARDRYRLLWDISIDGRLSSRGKTSLGSLQERFAEFQTAFGFWEEPRQREIFTELWKDLRPTHAGLLTLISDPRGLATRPLPGPGAACPLCGFSTFTWATGPELAAAAEAITAEFPQWNCAQGACARCARIYRHRSNAKCVSV